MASNPRLSVLKNRSDFLYILKNGQRLRPAPWLLVNFVPKSEGGMRCGWTLPRQVGSAVIRNRFKRWSRAYFRERLKEGLEKGKLPAVDVNLVFRKAEANDFKKLDYAAFCKILDRAWSQLQRRLENVKPASDRNVPNDR